MNQDNPDMEDKTLELIERFFRNELSAEERAAFGQRRAADAAFRQEVEGYEKTLRLIRLQGRQALKARLAGRGRQLDVEKGRNGFQPRWWMGLPVLAMIALAWWVWGERTEAGPPTLPGTETRSDPAKMEAPLPSGLEEQPTLSPQPTPPPNAPPPVTNFSLPISVPAETSRWSPPSGAKGNSRRKNSSGNCTGTASTGRPWPLLRAWKQAPGTMATCSSSGPTACWPGGRRKKQLYSWKMSSKRAAAASCRRRDGCWLWLT